MVYKCATLRLDYIGLYDSLTMDACLVIVDGVVRKCQKEGMYAFENFMIAY